MRTIDAASFKQQCMALLEELDPDGLVITSYGKPVARLLPFEHEHAKLIGSLHDKVKIRGDILSTGTDWDASGSS